ncbi:O-antigen ligase family protein [Candidatus Saccharibacteria bacterium]|nr:O-antigen ligase family protein [Candidatus Saccharibacteria bacterium]
MRRITTYPKLSRLLSLSVASILVLLPFHALFTTWIGSNTGHLDLLRIWKEILTVALIPPVILLVWQSNRVRQWLLTSWIVRLMAFYVLLSLAMGAWAVTHQQVNGVALIYALLINLRFFIFFVICAIIASSDNFLKSHWPKILLVPAAAVILFGLMQQFLLPYDFLRHFGYGAHTIPAYQTVDANLDYRRIQSTLRGANPLGAYLILILPALAVVLSKRRLLRIGGLITGAVTLFYSYSRSAWVGTGLAFGVLAVWLPKNSLWRRRKVVVMAIIGIVIVVAGLYALRYNQTTQDTLLHTSNNSTSSLSSNEARVAAMRAGASDVLHQPLGNGPGTAGPASFRNDHPARIAENYYLQIGQEIGILGMVIFVSINFLVARSLWLRRNEALCKILLASLIGLTFVNLLSHAWTDDTIAYLWWGLTGMACAPAILESRHKQHG